MSYNLSNINEFSECISTFKLEYFFLLCMQHSTSQVRNAQQICKELAFHMGLHSLSGVQTLYIYNKRRNLIIQAIKSWSYSGYKKAWRVVSPATFSKKTWLSDKTRFGRTSLSVLKTTKDRDFTAPCNTLGYFSVGNGSRNTQESTQKAFSCSTGSDYSLLICSCCILSAPW